MDGAAVADRDKIDPRSTAARERLTRRLVGLAVLTVVVTAASALLPPRGSAERAAPVPDEDAAGVEVQSVPLGGLVATGRPAAVAPVPTPEATVSMPASRAPSVSAARTAAEFAEDAPAPAREVTTLQDHAAEAFDERHLAPPPLAPAPHPVGAPVARASSAAPTAVAVSAPGPAFPMASRIAPGGRETWVVQIGVFSTRVKAYSVAGQMRSAGLPVARIETLQLASGATRYRVRIPTGGDAGTARTVRDRVNALPGAFGAAVKSIPAGG